MSASMTLRPHANNPDPAGSSTPNGAGRPTTPSGLLALWRRRHPAHWAGLALLAAWGAFWTWFVTFAALAEGLPSLVPALAIGSGVLLVTLTPWKWPRVGGLLAIAGAIAAAFIFQGASAWALMATPPAVGGLLLLLRGAPPRASGR